MLHCEQRLNRRFAKPLLTRKTKAYLPVAITIIYVFSIRIEIVPAHPIINVLTESRTWGFCLFVLYNRRLGVLIIIYRSK